MVAHLSLQLKQIILNSFPHVFFNIVNICILFAQFQYKLNHCVLQYFLLVEKELFYGSFNVQSRILFLLLLYFIPPSIQGIVQEWRGGTYIMLKTAWPDHQSTSKMCPRNCPKTSPNSCLKMCSTPKNISIPCTHHTYATPSFRKISLSSTLMSTYILKEGKFVNEIVQKCKYIGMG